MISLLVNRDQLGQAAGSLDRLQRITADLWRTMDAIGAYLVSSVQRRFQTGVAPDGTAWLTSIRARLFGGKTMLGSPPQLMPSIAHEATRDQVEVGSNKVYAAVHQLGATIHAKNAPTLKFRIGERWISKPSVVIPARPFLGIDARDQQEIEAIVGDALEAAEAGKA
jgi:phage virion morphogenesis protein